MNAIIFCENKEDIKIDIYSDQNLKNKNYKHLDDSTFYNNQLISKLNSLNISEGYALCVDSYEKYNLGVKKISLFAINFLNDNSLDWDIINVSPGDNEIWTAQRPLTVPLESTWNSIVDYMGANFIKRISKLPKIMYRKKYYMNTYCPIYIINLKNIKKIHNVLCPLKINNISINFLENLAKINVYFLNSNINKLRNKIDCDLDYNPTIFFDWYGGDPSNKIFYDNIFSIKIHKSLINHLVDEEIINRLAFKIDKKIIQPDFLKINWSTADSNYLIENNLIDINFDVKSYLQNFSHDKYWDSPFVLEVIFLCPQTGKKVKTEKKLFLKKLTNKR